MTSVQQRQFAGEIGIPPEHFRQSVRPMHRHDERTFQGNDRLQFDNPVFPFEGAEPETDIPASDFFNPASVRDEHLIDRDGLDNVRAPLREDNLAPHELASPPSNCVKLPNGTILTRNRIGHTTRITTSDCPYTRIGRVSQSETHSGDSDQVDCVEAKANSFRKGHSFHQFRQAVGEGDSLDSANGPRRAFEFENDVFSVMSDPKKQSDFDHCGSASYRSCRSGAPRPSVRATGNSGKGKHPVA